MVFNTGAALLDAVVLAVVSREEEGTYGYKITRMYVRHWSIRIYVISCSPAAEERRMS